MDKAMCRRILVVSASLECDERTKLPEDRAFEENSTTPQAEESEYEAAHVKDGETKAVTNDTEEEGDDEDSSERKLLEKEDIHDGEREVLADATGANIGSDAPIDTDSEDHTSHQQTEHSEQVEEHVKSSEDSSDEEYHGYYEY
ncbi:uncharacterized protein [Garra rufa]|uniref:uncharacterized protein n=1 Tax=Garra rufa TaxID=137080 RepID=UPI003CCE9820